MGQSVWENKEKTERIIFLYNTDFDDAKDVELHVDDNYSAEIMTDELKWQELGVGNLYKIPTIKSWETSVIRLVLKK